MNMQQRDFHCVALRKPVINSTKRSLDKISSPSETRLYVDIIFIIRLGAWAVEDYLVLGE